MKEKIGLLLVDKVQIKENVREKWNLLFANKVTIKQKTFENLFFFAEVIFLLTTCMVALYNIYFDKNMIPILALLGGYILTIKALRRMVLEPAKLKEKKTKYMTFGFLTISTYIVMHVTFLLVF